MTYDIIIVVVGVDAGELSDSEVDGRGQKGSRRQVTTTTITTITTVADF